MSECSVSLEVLYKDAQRRHLRPWKSKSRETWWYFTFWIFTVYTNWFSWYHGHCDHNQFLLDLWMLVLLKQCRHDVFSSAYYFFSSHVHMVYIRAFPMAVVCVSNEIATTYGSSNRVAHLQTLTASVLSLRNSPRNIQHKPYCSQSFTALFYVKSFYLWKARSQHCYHQSDLS